MDPELMAALQGGGGAPPGAPPMVGPGGPPMPMMSPPAMGGTPADIAMQISMMMAPQQQAEKQAFEKGQADQLLSALAAAVGQLPNPLGAAAMSEGALPPPPDELGAPVSEEDPAMAGVV